ncbi:hypothetical protein VMCG_03197 [Cytospora schulzeri]|uniref:BTB domain-containing protein n=1 Tax=Cytospora schulzeri TaxID=448051 RepID=A0A423WXT8_9PEZI|nr:hypothetical protein VMCG_03197 [Valsa malicola]
MSSTSHQASAALEQVKAQNMPLPDSRPESPICNPGENRRESDYNVKCDKPVVDNVVPTTAEVNMTVPIDGNDKASFSNTYSKETDLTSSTTNTPATHVVTPEITISTNHSEDDASPGVEATVTNTEFAKYNDQDEVKYTDPNDKANEGDVITYFFTSSTRKGPHSPVTSEPGCCNPHLGSDSDLYIKARDKNGHLYVFEVVSTVLEKASPRFENMVYGTHARGNREVWVWELPDNPLGLKIMFCLLHNKFPRAMLVTKPKPSQLYTVLRVLHDYQVDLEATNFHLLAKPWIEVFRKSLPKSKLNHLQALYVAHKLGDFKSLKQIIRKVAHDVSIGEDGFIRDENGSIVQEVVPIDEELLKNIKNIRGKHIEAILKSLKDPYEYLMDTEKSNGQDYCKSVDGHLECNQKLLGSLLSNLLQQKLFPVPEPQSYNGSLDSLVEKIDKMEIRGLFYPGVEMHKQRHTLCRLGQDAVIEKLRGGKEDVPLSDDLVEYMFFMCKRCGSFRDERKEFEAYKGVVRDLNTLHRDEFQKDIWGWMDPDKSDTESDTDDNCDDDDSGLFDVADHSVWIERKVSTDLELRDFQGCD